MKLSCTAAVVALCCLPVSSARSQDEWSKDHPLVKRYPGSEPMGHPGLTHDYDEMVLVLGAVKGENEADKTQKVEGRTYQVDYRNPEGRSLLEVYKNYEQALLGAGFQRLYACEGQACGAGAVIQGGSLQFYDPSYLRRFLVVKLSRSQGDAYVQVLVQAQESSSAGDTQLRIVEAKPMQTGMVVVDAAALGRDIGATGHVAIYGIYFDSGKSVVKPESDPTLKEIARLLSTNPKLKLTVVGHTDSVGELSTNLQLSRARAKAVSDILTGKYGIAGGRLSADGVGPLAPVASNRTEEGRAKNRRVELVDLSTQ